jgi:iron complex transport system substrate-binding protein
MLLGRLILIFFAAAAALCAQPRRIISTAPSITEMLFALGAGDRVVGVTTFCHYPPEATKITKIGTYLEPNLETILSLKPDLVVAETSPIHRDQFASLGLRTVRVRFETVQDVYGSLRTIGAAIGAPDRAERLVHDIERDLEDVRRRVSKAPPVSAMFVVGRTPNSLDGMVATGNAPYMNAIMEIAGGRNVFRDASMRYFKVSTEQVIARDPEVILDMGDMADTKTVTEEHKRLVLNLWQQRMPMLKAVQRQRVYAVASDVFVVPGPRVAEGARAFARLLHPEVFR